MSEPDIIANMARGWNRDPANVVTGTVRTGVSAALWTHDCDDVQEVWAEPDPNVHIITVMQASFFADVRKDGRPVFANPIRLGTVSLMEAGVRPHAIHRGRWSVLHLYLPASLVTDFVEREELVSEGRRVELVDPQCTQDLFIEQIGREVLSEMREGAPLTQLRVDALGQELAIRMLRGHSNLIGTRALSRPQLQGGLAPWQVKRVCEAMVAAMDQGEEEASLAELALLVGLSANHFCRGFAQSTGQPPHRWMTERRIERAKALMTDPRLSLTEIALAVGYTSQNTLGRSFKRITGVTPSEWRRTLGS